jgi:hypothetical protein
MHASLISYLVDQEMFMDAQGFSDAEIHEYFQARKSVRKIHNISGMTEEPSKLNQTNLDETPKEMQDRSPNLEKTNEVTEIATERHA